MILFMLASLLMRDLRNWTFFLLGFLVSISLLTAAAYAADTATEAGHGISARAGQVPGAPTLESAESRFLRRASARNAAEIELGKLAASRGSSEAIKDLGERMVRDHGAANEELHMLAQRKGVEMQTQPDRRHRALLRDLARREGRDFDRLLVRQMVKDYDADAKAFHRMANSASDPDVRAYAQKNAGPIEEHLEVARALDAQLRGPSANTGAGRAARRSAERFGD